MIDGHLTERPNRFQKPVRSGGCCTISNRNDLTPTDNVSSPALNDRSPTDTASALVDIASGATDKASSTEANSPSLELISLIQGFVS